MGGGNAQKSAMKRQRNADKLAKGGAGSQVKQNLAAQSIKCVVCLSTFVCTSTEAKLREHSDNKHPNKDFFDCFPDRKPEEE